jgi:hypothetical protein
VNERFIYEERDLVGITITRVASNEDEAPEEVDRGDDEGLQARLRESIASDS